MKLTEAQMDFYRVFGFLIFRQLLSSDEMVLYNREFNPGIEAWLKYYKGKQMKGRRRKVYLNEYGLDYQICVPLMDHDTPFICSLLDDHRFVDTAEQLLGTDVLGIWSDAAWFYGDTQWHTDQVTSKYRAVKFAIYPDPLNESNGALRVIPGSHHDSFSKHVNDETAGIDTCKKYGIPPDEMPAYVFRLGPGDVVAFGNPLWHASYNGGKRRRLGVVMFTEDPKTPYALDNIQRIMHNMHKRLAVHFGGQFYPDYWRSIDNPRHQNWVRRLKELDMLETAEAAAYKGN